MALIDRSIKRLLSRSASETCRTGEALAERAGNRWVHHRALRERAGGDERHRRSRFRFLATGSLFLAGALAIAGCRQDAASVRDRQNKPLVGFVGLGQDDPLWPVLRAGAERYLQLFTDVQVQFVAPERSSPRAQIQLVRSLLDRKAAALCIQIEDPDLLKPTIEAAFKQGVPVYTMVRDAAKRSRAAFIGFEEQEVGRVLAETTLNSIAGQGAVALIHAGFDHPVYGTRYQYFESTMRNQSRIRILRRLNCEAQPRKADAMLRDMLIRYPNLKGVILLANWPFMFDSAEPYPVPNTCRIFSVGATPEYWPLLEDGPCFALVGFEYDKIGFKALQYATTAILPQRMANPLKLEFVPTRVVWATTLPRFKADWFQWTSLPIPNADR